MSAMTIHCECVSAINSLSLSLSFIRTYECLGTDLIGSQKLERWGHGLIHRRIFFPIISLWELNNAMATRVHYPISQKTLRSLSFA